MCEIHGPRASDRHKTLRLRRRVLWCPEFLVPCISHITQAMIKAYITSRGIPADCNYSALP